MKNFSSTDSAGDGLVDVPLSNDKVAVLGGTPDGKVQVVFPQTFGFPGNLY